MELLFGPFCYSASSGERRISHAYATVDGLVSGLTKHNFSNLKIEIYTTVFYINLRGISSNEETEGRDLGSQGNHRFINLILDILMLQMIF